MHTSLLSQFQKNLIPLQSPDFSWIDLKFLQLSKHVWCVIHFAQIKKNRVYSTRANILHAWGIVFILHKLKASVFLKVGQHRYKRNSCRCEQKNPILALITACRHIFQFLCACELGTVSQNINLSIKNM